MRRSNEPLWWLPFSGGMMIDALAMPALIIITGFFSVAGLLGANFHTIVAHPITRAILCVIVIFTFFHAAHRIRFTLQDVGLKEQKGILSFLCYGGAILGSLIAILVCSWAI